MAAKCSDFLAYAYDANVLIFHDERWAGGAWVDLPTRTVGVTLKDRYSGRFEVVQADVESLDPSVDPFPGLMDAAADRFGLRGPRPIEAGSIEDD